MLKCAWINILILLHARMYSSSQLDSLKMWKGGKEFLYIYMISKQGRLYENLWRGKKKRKKYENKQTRNNVKNMKWC